MISRPSAIITASDLAKRYGEVTAVESVSFEVQDGDLFGFLGPNGAGKTTTINMLIGLARPDSGSIHIGGIDCSRHPKAAQHLMGIVPDESNLYPELTGFENLCFCGALYGLRRKDRETRARELLDSFGLTPAANRRFGGYSKGMKRKLTIAAGIIHQPRILILDEPTTGIDVASARQIRQLMADLNAQGTTILMTTHYIEEAERLCRRIAFIVRGRIVRIDSLETLLRGAEDRHLVEFHVADTASDVCSAIVESFPLLRCQAVSNQAIHVESPHPISIAPLVRFIDERGVEVTEARKIRPSLEDVFVHVTGIDANILKQEREKPGKEVRS